MPDSPLVLHATRLVKEGETERLGFTAPPKPGEYIFVCTFPGHWVRMYGVMLVVEKLDAWEAKPTVPIDPMTKQPFTRSTRTQLSGPNPVTICYPAPMNAGLFSGTMDWHAILIALTATLVISVVRGDPRQAAAQSGR